jgi:diguanylate cyclase (GGDEF)-like protein
LIFQNIYKNEKKLQELSLVDELTNMHNRRFFNQIILSEFRKAIRSKTYLSFMMLDVDNFKLYNDTYGHSMGDNVLISIADTIKKTLKRDSDYSFRLGGEEFGILLLSTNAKNSQEIANNILTSIQNLKITHQKNSPSGYVTASIGLTTTIPNRDYSIDKLITNSDKLLYQAKHEGRNRVISKELIFK